MILPFCVTLKCGSLASRVTPKRGLLVKSIMILLYGGIHPPNYLALTTRRLTFAQNVDKWKGVYTNEDRKKILEYCDNTEPTVYTKAIELMFCLDIRIGELRALYKEDVNFESRTIYVGHQMVDVKQRVQADIPFDQIL